MWTEEDTDTESREQIAVKRRRGGVGQGESHTTSILTYTDGENAADVLLTLALKGSLGTLFPNVPVRALFDRVSAELAKMDMLTQEDVTEMLLFMAAYPGMGPTSQIFSLARR